MAFILIQLNLFIVAFILASIIFIQKQSVQAFETC